MKKTAIIYSYNTNHSKQVAKEILENFGSSEIEEINAEDINGEKFLSYDNLILSTPTWFDGELPNYWDEFVPEIETLNLKGKKIAIFGTGNQIDYPENFLDAVGILADILELRGADIVGQTPIEGYTFERSKAISNGKFIGLAIDFENQSELNTKRIKAWVSDLKKQFV
jgi:flavodoxin I